MHCRYLAVNQTCPLQLGQYAHYPTGAMHIFNMVFRSAGGHLTQLRDDPRQPIYIIHIKIDTSLLNGRE
jgi:hypothetical protein